MERFNHEDLVQNLTWEHADIHGVMLEYREIPRPPVMSSDLSTRPSSAGTFDTLPLELIHSIFENIDLLSLQNIGYTSVRSRALVESLPAYRDLVIHATSSITVLRRTGLIVMHSTAKVHEILLHARCCICNDYAPFLYIPTCERCCLNCLYNERCLRMMPVSTAQLCFGLTPKEMRNIPKLFTVAGAYGDASHSHSKRLLLVSARHAQEAAILKYGDRDAMNRAVRDADARREARYQHKLIAQSSSQRDSNRMSNRPPSASWVLTDPNDRYRFMGSTPMPWLANSKDLRTGVWCLGYHNSWRGFVSHEVHPGHEDSYQPGETASNKMLGRDRRAFSRMEFLEHVWNCPGARRWMEKANYHFESEGPLAS